MLTYLEESQLVYYYKSRNEHYDDFVCSAQKSSDEDEFLKLPCHQKNLKHKFDGLYNQTTKIAHFDLNGRTTIKLGRWSL
jgi:hypothetical protein